jgi:predicted amino acid-binding ACT domain protein
MSYRLHRVHAWSVEVEDVPGGVAAKLAKLAEAGANLEFVFTRRLTTKPGAGVLFVAPVSGPEVVRAAQACGMHEAQDPIVMRVEGDNSAGLAHRLTQQWAREGINLHELSMVVVGSKFVGYAAFDSVEDANMAATILAHVGHTEPALAGTAH